MRGVRGLACALAIAGLSCGQTRTGGGEPPEEAAALGGELAARVGDEAIPLSLVQKVAAQQRIEPREALRRLVDDAVAAQAARGRGYDRTLPARWRLMAVRARFTADRALAEAKTGGDPTDAEIARLSELYWREVDRPEAVRVVHAVVRRPKDASKLEEARALAAQIREAVADVEGSDAFLKSASAVPHPKDLEVVAQPLPPFTDDGWGTEGDGRMDPAFAKASHAIGAVGATSDLVETSFGWHVIRLLERIPEARMPLESRRVAFVDEAYRLRASNFVQDRLAAQRAAVRVEVSAAAEPLMRALVAASSEERAPSGSKP